MLCLTAFAAVGNSFAQTTKAQLEVSETIFTMAAALNSCGYDAGLDNSLPLRQTIRTEVQRAIQKSPEAVKAQQTICQFQREHTPADASRDVSQYISLALDLGDPPEFIPTLHEADLPPDAAQVLGIVDLLQILYQAAGLHAIWQKHLPEYNAQVQRFHDPVANALTQTDLYLKLPFSSYLGRRFVVFLEPLLAPSQVNSRNYGDNYFMVLSPAREGEQLHLHEIRHTYLHYVLDPMALKHAQSLKRLDPLLGSIQSAPFDNSYKEDISLLVNESLIRAIEARTLPAPGRNEEARIASMQHSMEEGFILSQYFYEALVKFEKESTGLKDAYGDFLFNIVVSREKKRASEITFASQAAPEVVTAASKQVQHDDKLLDNAEQRLVDGDTAGAQKLAQEALNDPKSNQDTGRALFILARAATRSGDMQGARAYFERAVQSAHDPRTLAWSHIYLGRIFDIQQERDTAVSHYRAALQAGDPTPDTRAAAEKGLAGPYEPPRAQH